MTTTITSNPGVLLQASVQAMRSQHRPPRYPVLAWCLLLVLICSLGEARGLMMRGSCQKAHKSIHFTVPGYFTSPIHINECRETVSSAISPVVSLNPSELLLFRRHYSSCCCAIGNTSVHQMELLSVDGRPPITLHYRRIEECVCVDCADLSTHRRPLLDSQ